MTKLPNGFPVALRHKKNWTHTHTTHAHTRRPGHNRLSSLNAHTRPFLHSGQPQSIQGYPHTASHLMPGLAPSTPSVLPCRSLLCKQCFPRSKVGLRLSHSLFASPTPHTTHQRDFPQGISSTLPGPGPGPCPGTSRMARQSKPFAGLLFLSLLSLCRTVHPGTKHALPTASADGTRVRVSVLTSVRTKMMEASQVWVCGVCKHLPSIYPAMPSASLPRLEHLLYQTPKSSTRQPNFTNT